MNITINDGRKEFYQWDVNQKLLLENMPADSKIHFARSGDDEAVVVEIQRVNNTYTANVPNFVLQTEGIFYAYVYEKNNEREDTVYKKSFRVNGREKPTSYIYKETELFTFEQIKKELLDKINNIDEIIKTKSDDEFLEQMSEDGMIEPIADSNGAIFTDVNNKIYIL